jgi:hypothetical protein
MRQKASAWVVGRAGSRWATASASNSFFSSEKEGLGREAGAVLGRPVEADGEVASGAHEAVEAHLGQAGDHLVDLRRLAWGLPLQPEPVLHQAVPDGRLVEAGEEKLDRFSCRLLQLELGLQVTVVQGHLVEAKEDILHRVSCVMVEVVLAQQHTVPRGHLVEAGGRGLLQLVLEIHQTLALGSDVPRREHRLHQDDPT